MSIEVYRAEFRLGDKKPTTGDLFRILQDAATMHCDIIGYGGDVMEPLGLMWVIARYKVDVKRYPRANEHIAVDTWPVPARHMLFPRHYLVKDDEGNVIIEASAIWTVVERQERKMVNPTPYGVDFGGIITGNELRLPTAPKKLPIMHDGSFVVPEDYLDVNGHMNNTRYYELAEKFFGERIEGMSLKAASTEYAAEALLGDELKLSWGWEENRYYIIGENEGTVFKMNLEYA